MRTSRTRAPPTLGAITSLSDAGFAKHIGVGGDDFGDFKRQYHERIKQSSLADVAWLPEGMDLAGLVFDSVEGSGADT